MEFLAIEPGDNIVNENQMIGRYFEYGATIAAKYVKKEKDFQLGEEFLLEKFEFKELLMCILQIGTEINKKAIEKISEIHPIT